MTQEAIELTRRARVIAVNDAYLVAPWADLLYFADHQWWKWHSEGLKKMWPWASFPAEEVKRRFAEFPGQKMTIENTGMMISDAAVFMLHNSGPDGLSEKPNAICTGCNGGYQAVNIAVLAGAKRILLVGYDMRFTGGRSHSHNGHPTRQPESAYARYAQSFKTMLPQLKRLGVEVVNCTPGSLIACFPRAELVDALTAA